MLDPQELIREVKTAPEFDPALEERLRGYFAIQTSDKRLTVSLDDVADMVKASTPGAELRHILSYDAPRDEIRRALLSALIRYKAEEQERV